MIQRQLTPYFYVVVVFLVFMLLYQSSYVKDRWRRLPETVGMGESVGSQYDSPNSISDIKLNTYNPKANYKPGVAKEKGEKYNVTTIIVKMKEDDISWIDQELPNLQKIVYVADDPKAQYHPPKNKGHEVMIYLSYLIDNYDQLPDVSVFMHSHRYTWHNNEILGHDAAQMLKNLNPNRVYREGYMNVRCHWYPGCPDWMHPGETAENRFKMEEVMLAKAWSELFPLDPVPEVLAQPCCAQFALSRERIHALPLSKYIFYRDWLFRTQLDDAISGRVWEYMWQFVFTGENAHCPEEHACYCDGYGVCFGGKNEYENHMDLRRELGGREHELREWEDKGKAIEEALADGKLDEAAALEKPEPGKDQEIKVEIEKVRKIIEDQKTQAMKNGESAQFRAKECGRTWQEGDGF